MRNVIYYGNSHSVNIKTLIITLDLSGDFHCTLSKAVKTLCLHLFLLGKIVNRIIVEGYLNIYK